MKRVVLSTDSSRSAQVLEDELERIKERKFAKVYRTTVHSEVSPVSESFITTSKDLHLKLGQMSEEAQWELAMLIREHLSDHTSGQLLIFEDEEGHGAILATIVLNKGDSDLHIHLSPAN